MVKSELSSQNAYFDWLRIVLSLECSAIQGERYSNITILLIKLKDWKIAILNVSNLE